MSQTASTYYTEKTSKVEGVAVEQPFRPTNHREEVAEVKKEIVDAYDHRPTENLFERRLSPVYTVRTITNWVKSSLIKTFCRPGARVLDLGCGHGTDLLKYSANHIGYYVGVDMSHESLKEAIRRYNAANANFPAKFVQLDITQHTVNRDDVLEHGITFDIVSSQLTMQFAWTGERAVRTFFRNATDRLAPGGYFIGCFPDPIKIMAHLVASPDHQTIRIGDVCKIRFRKYLDEINQNTDPYAVIYDVSLGEVLDNVPEYLISFPVLEKMANEYGLESRLFMNFQEFYTNYKHVPPFTSLLRIHDAPIDEKLIPPAEWEVLSLYTVFAFQKQQGTTVKRCPPLTEADIVVVK